MSPKPMAAAEVQLCYPFPALRGNMSDAPWSDRRMGKAQSSTVGNALLAIQTQIEFWEEMFKSNFHVRECAYISQGLRA
jgi:hypothetical protein